MTHTFVHTRNINILGGGRGRLCKIYQRRSEDLPLSYCLNQRTAKTNTTRNLPKAKPHVMYPQPQSTATGKLQRAA